MTSLVTSTVTRDCPSLSTSSSESTTVSSDRLRIPAAPDHGAACRSVARTEALISDHDRDKPFKSTSFTSARAAARPGGDFSVWTRDCGGRSESEAAATGTLARRRSGCHGARPGLIAPIIIFRVTGAGGSGSA